MERSMSIASNAAQDSTDCLESGDMSSSPAPWERSYQQVPYMKPGSPPPTGKLSPPPGQASRDEDYQYRAHWDRQTRSRGSSQSPKQDYTQQPMPSARLPQSVPYHDKENFPRDWRSPSLPPAMGKSPSPPMFSARISPPLKSSVPKDSAAFESPVEQASPVQAINGTMSARAVKGRRNRTTKKSTNDCIITEQPVGDSELIEKPQTESFGKRFKSALKGAFKPSPVDYSNIQKIDDNHWSGGY